MTVVWTVLSMSFVATVFTNCSDDDVAEEGQENSEDGIFDMSSEMIEKIHSIYSSASTGPQKVTGVNQLAILTSICASKEVEGPISVTDALLNDEPITLITLGGTQDVEGQATTMKESQLAAFGQPNDYLKAVTDLFQDGQISQEKPVMVTGISLGGMIAQQLLGEQQVIADYSIRAVITFGSPITLPLNRHEVQVVRFCDEHDKVPQLGESLLRSGMITAKQMTKAELEAKLEELDETERITRTSKYKDLVETHALSYIEDQCWSATDFMGNPEKTNVLELVSDMKFYAAPKRVE